MGADHMLPNRPINGMGDLVLAEQQMLRSRHLATILEEDLKRFGPHLTEEVAAATRERIEELRLDAVAYEARIAEYERGVLA